MNLKCVPFQFWITLFIPFSFNLALAAIPLSLNYQGHLTDAKGVSVDGVVEMTFRIYDAETGGVELWRAAHNVSVDHGLFSIELGSANPSFPARLFERPLWMGLSVGADAEMIPRRPLTSTGFTFKAGDADLLEGYSASALDQSAHVIDMVNPHNVTTAVIGAISGSDLTAHESNSPAHHAKTSSFSELSGQVSDAQIPPLITRDAEIMPTVLSNDGPGSTLNADLLDGFTAAAFMAVSADNWVNTTGDVMTGSLALPANGLTAGGTQLSLSGGNVGIGTTSPKQRLHVNGGYYGRGHFYLHANEGDGSSGTAYLQARDDSGASSIRMGLRTQNAGSVTETMTLSSAGDVGIGTTNPSAKLDIAATGSGTELLRLSMEREWAFRQLGAGANTHLELASIGGGGNKNFVISTTGNVGIGTSTPATNLDVTGAARVSGNLTVNGRIAGSARGTRIYTGISACGSAGAITLQDACTTNLCAPLPLFWTCNTECTAISPPTCPLPLLGYLVAP